MKMKLAIGMIAFLSMDARALPFAQSRAATGRTADVANTNANANANANANTNANANALSELLRVRVARLHGPSFTLSGSDIAIKGMTTATGYHAYKFVRTKRTWKISDRDTNRQFAEVNSLDLQGENLRLNLKALPPHIVVGSQDVIATLNLETYLRGVLPAEMPASWPLEALKAQAIAARTFALFRQAHSTHSGFDLDSDTMDQMFDSGQGSPLTDRAIKETEGQTLRDQRAQVFAAYFHADCGGHTEEAKNVWGAGESMGVATDDGCPLNPKAQWSLRLTNEQLSNRLRQHVLNVSLGERSNSGRVLTVRVNGVAIASNEFRAKLGYNELKSTAFQIETNGGGYLFKGQGFGHGVGLCQWGARQMAKKGSTYKEILAHYYPKAVVTNKLDGHPNFRGKENNGTYNEQAAQFHKESLPKL